MEQAPRQPLQTNPFVFEKARDAVMTLKSLKPALSSAELETLALLFDTEAMDTIEQSVNESNSRMFEPLEAAVRS